jgi:hypothetical protein
MVRVVHGYIEACSLVSPTLAAPYTAGRRRRCFSSLWWPISSLELPLRRRWQR